MRKRDKERVALVTALLTGKIDVGDTVRVRGCDELCIPVGYERALAIVRSFEPQDSYGIEFIGARRSKKDWWWAGKDNLTLVSKKLL